MSSNVADWSKVVVLGTSLFKGTAVRIIILNAVNRIQNGGMLIQEQVSTNKFPRTNKDLNGHETNPNPP